MRRLILMIAVLAGLAGPAVAQCAMHGGGQEAKAALAAAVNRFRESQGLRALAVSGPLERAATGHACAMVARNQFTHAGGGGLKARIRREGCRARFVGETIAMGYSGADATLRQWIDSPPHRRILLSRQAGAMGIGVAAPRKGQGGGPRWVLDVADGC